MPDKDNKWWVLAAVACALSMIFLDQTAVSVALPSMQRDLHISQLSLQWIVNAYLLALSSVIILGGRIGDLFGHRRIFLCGMVVFVVASALCGFALSGWFAICARLLQGIGAAFMIPSSGVQIVSVFPQNERGKAIGIYVGVSSIFLMLGPLLGGFLSEYASWRVVFWLNIPIGILCCILTLLFAKKSPRQAGELDWTGFFWLSIAIVSLVFAMMQGIRLGWTSCPILSCFALSILAFVIFLYNQPGKKDPLVDLTLFRQGPFRHSILILIFAQMSLICVVFWAIFLQTIIGFSPAVSGMLIMPVMLPMLFMAPIAGRLYDSYGPRWPASCGVVLIGFGSLWIAAFAQHYDYMLLFPGFVAFGFAAPLVISNCMTTALSTVELHHRGVAAGIANSGRQLGGAIGIAIFGSIIMNIDKFYLLKTNILSGPKLDEYLKGGDYANQAVAHLNPDQLTNFMTLAKSTYTTGFRFAMATIAIFAIIGFFIAIKLPSESISTLTKENAS